MLGLIVLSYISPKNRFYSSLAVLMDCSLTPSKALTVA